MFIICDCCNQSVHNSRITIVVLEDGKKEIRLNVCSGCLCEEFKE